MAKSSFLKTLSRSDSFSSIDDADSISESDAFIDTGVLLLNMQLSGSFSGGYPTNKILALAGESTTGKTYFALSLVKSFLDQNPSGFVVYADTESAVTKQMFAARGIDTSRVLVMSPESVEHVQSFRQALVELLKKYEEIEETERDPMLVVLDSLGALPSSKELRDVEEAKDVKDMSRASIIRSLFRVCRLKLSKLRVPMIITNHTYASLSPYSPGPEMGGGHGIKYSSDIIIYLSKKAVKDETTKSVNGFIIHSKLQKSRFTRERTSIDTLLSYETGLDRYYGLLDKAVEVEFVKKLSAGRYEFPDRKTSVTAKEIDANPEAFWTPTVLKSLEEVLRGQFLYASVEASTVGVDD